MSRRALMAAARSGIKTITIPQAIATGADVLSVFNQVITDNQLSAPCVFMTTKPVESWAYHELVIVVIQTDGTILRSCICCVNSSTTKTFINTPWSAETEYLASSGQVFEVMEAAHL